MPRLTAEMPLALYNPSTIGLPPRTTGQHLLYATGLSLGATVLGGFLGLVSAGVYNSVCQHGRYCRGLRARNWVITGASLGLLAGITVSIIAVSQRKSEDSNR